MEVKLSNDWKEFLKDQFEAEYFKNIVEFVRSENGKFKICPPGKFIFKAFDSCPLDKVKVVILGQDPYHTKGVANGLAFSTNEGQRIPPSL